MNVNYIYIVGTAGSGKSTLTLSFGDWLRENNVNAILVNLDPGATIIPYEPDVDIRDYIKVEDIMEKYDLGPNGALIMSMDLLVNHLEYMSTEIQSLRPEYVIIDTAGQMELFAFRSVAPIVVSTLKRDNQAVILFLMDATLASSPSNLVSTLLLSSSVKFRFQLPQINILTKIDIISKEKIEEILACSADFWLLYEALTREGGGLTGQMAKQISQALNELGALESPIPVSPLTGEGIPRLYGVIQEVLASGEDYGI